MPLKSSDSYRATDIANVDSIPPLRRTHSYRAIDNAKLDSISIPPILIV